MLIDTDVPGFGVPWTALAAVVVASALFMALVLGFAWRARRRPVVSGRAELIGATGAVVEAAGDEAWAHIHGELWRVRSRQPLAAGELVEVTGVDGLTLNVIHRATNQRGA